MNERARRRGRDVLAVAMLGGLLGLAGGACSPPPPAVDTAASKHVLLVLDGLRPDYVTEELMPALTALAARGVFFARHHAVFPTVTRVNAASIATGAYPETHGLLDNVVYFPGAAPGEPMSTSERANLLRIAETEPRLLEAVTLGEVLAAAGRTLFVASTGSSGSSFLLNPVAAPAVGNRSFIVHPEYTEPASFATVVERRLGTAPAESELPAQRQRRHRWAMRALVEIGLDEVDADVAIVWLADPDSTVHRHGIGSEAGREALRVVDGEVAWLLGELRQRHLEGRVNLLVGTDHGFSTHVGEQRLDAALSGLLGEASAAARPGFVAAGHAVYLTPETAPRLNALVLSLRQLPWIGALFTAAREPGSAEGVVPGTLSFDVMRGGHRRAGDLVVDLAWSDEENEHGYRGSTAAPGVAGHGSSSRWDIHATLVVAGPDFARGEQSEVPSSNVDLAPTLLHLLGLEAPETMQGRVLEEVLAGSSGPDRAAELRRASSRDGAWEVEAEVSVVGERRYLDQTRVIRH